MENPPLMYRSGGGLAGAASTLDSIITLPTSKSPQGVRRRGSSPASSNLEKLNPPASKVKRRTTKRPRDYEEDRDEDFNYEDDLLLAQVGGDLMRMEKEERSSKAADGHLETDEEHSEAGGGPSEAEIVTARMAEDQLILNLINDPFLNLENMTRDGNPT